MGRTTKVVGWILAFAVLGITTYILGDAADRRDACLAREREMNIFTVVFITDGELEKALPFADYRQAKAFYDAHKLDIAEYLPLDETFHETERFLGYIMGSELDSGECWFVDIANNP